MINGKGYEMARNQVDGVLEAVRYDSSGNIIVARAYERRGAVWSDWTLLERKILVEKLQQGKRFVTGVRKTYLGNVFETGHEVYYSAGHIVTNGLSSKRDLLSDTSIF
jgi:hypothetical protein